MPYTISAATAEDRTLVVDALRTAADQRIRVARKASAGVAADKRAGKDVRPAAIRVALLLAEADTLESLAAEIEAAVDLPVVRHATPLPDVTGMVALTDLKAGEPVAVDVATGHITAARTFPVPGVDYDPATGVASLADDAVAVSLGTEDDEEDDGTSAAAQAAAELAGLTPTDPEAVEDDLGRLPEDLVVDEVEEVLPR